jgi:hypothetical protein
MAQSLEVNIKATSDIPQAMDKAKAATNSFGSQVEGIGKKFGSSFKDIFLSFLGPMAILTTVLALIGKMIADNQKKRDDAHQAALNDTNELMSAEDRYYEKKKANEKKDKETKEQAKLTREEVTADFLRQGVDRGDKQIRDIVFNYADKARKEGKGYGIATMAEDKAIQDQVQALIAADIAKNPAAAAPTGPTSFKTPEGFGNVVGVGANPVMEAMTLQLEEAKKQTALLESLNNKSPGGGVPVDFTKPQPLNAASRSGSI